MFPSTCSLQTNISSDQSHLEPRDCGNDQTIVQTRVHENYEIDGERMTGGRTVHRQRTLQRRVDSSTHNSQGRLDSTDRSGSRIHQSNNC